MTALKPYSRCARGRPPSASACYATTPSSSGPPSRSSGSWESPLPGSRTA